MTHPFARSVFPDNMQIWIIKVWSKWENVNETKDGQTLALIWWRRNEERGKLSQDHVHADTWETDEEEAIVFVWMQIQEGAEDGERQHIRIGDPSSSVYSQEESRIKQASQVAEPLRLYEDSLWHRHTLTQTDKWILHRVQFTTILTALAPVHILVVRHGLAKSQIY